LYGRDALFDVGERILRGSCPIVEVMKSPE
jgi:hypothetical protein